ncbi:hypothetical protein EON66_06630 [archaeon]|nr:MAG: hypothetical protein EON66_06630 [archaeon]
MQGVTTAAAAAAAARDATARDAAASRGGAWSPGRKLTPRLLPFQMDDRAHAARYSVEARPALSDDIDAVPVSRPGSVRAAGSTARPGTKSGSGGSGGSGGGGFPRLPSGGAKCVQRVGTGAGGSRAPLPAAYNVVVLIENRAREVGIATCNLAALHTLELVQVADNQSFTQTLAFLDLLQPVEILLPKSQVERVMCQKVIAAWADRVSPHATQISAIHRKYVKMMPKRVGRWGARPKVVSIDHASAPATPCPCLVCRFFDDGRGAEELQRLSCKPLSSTLLHKYLCLASAAALLKVCACANARLLVPRAMQSMHSDAPSCRQPLPACAYALQYVEHLQHLTFADGSLNVALREPSGRMVRVHTRSSVCVPKYCVSKYSGERCAHWSATRPPAARGL